MLSRIKSLDERVLNNISRLHSPAMNVIMKTASRSANVGIVWWLICLPFLLRAEWRNTGINFVVALAVTHLMGEGLIKRLVKRVRPCHSLEDEEQIINRPRFYSFPSGHSAASFAMVGVALVRCRLIVFIPILLLASLIAFSRIYLRVHYLTDVLVGAALGFTIGALSPLALNAVGLLPL